MESFKKIIIFAVVSVASFAGIIIALSVGLQGSPRSLNSEEAFDRHLKANRNPQNISSTE
jgi:hypothetical protein